MRPVGAGIRQPVGVRQPVRPAAAVVLALALGGLAACSGGTKKIEAASSDATTTTTLSAADEATSSTTLKPATSVAPTTTTQRLSSTTIAYFTVPSTTTEPPGSGGSFPSGESVGRRFTDAVMDGNRSAAAALAPKSVLDQFEPWKPAQRGTVDGTAYPTYKYSGGTTKGAFDFSTRPTIFVHCTVEKGQVTTCATGD
jgi:hypothetical protein